MNPRASSTDVISQAELLLAEARAGLVRSQTFYRKYGIDPTRIEQFLDDATAGRLKQRLLDALPAESSGAEARPAPPSTEEFGRAAQSAPKARKLRLRV